MCMHACFACMVSREHSDLMAVAVSHIFPPGIWFYFMGSWNSDIPRTALAKYYGYTERGGRYLDEAERAPVVQSGMRFVQRYLELAKLAIRRGMLD